MSRDFTLTFSPLFSDQANHMTVMKGMAFFVASCLLLVVIMSPVHAVVDPMPDLDKISVKMPNVSLVHVSLSLIVGQV